MLCLFHLFSGWFPSPLFKVLFQLKAFSQFQICPSCVSTVSWLVFSILPLCILPCPEANSVSFVVNSLMPLELLYKNKFSKDQLQKFWKFSSISCTASVSYKYSLSFYLSLNLSCLEAFHECLVIFGNLLIHNIKLLNIYLKGVRVGAA